MSASRWRDDALIHVANGGDLCVGNGGESLDVDESLAAHADNANPHAVVGPSHFLRLRQEADAAQGGKTSAVFHSRLQKVTPGKVRKVCHHTL